MNTTVLTMKTAVINLGKAICLVVALGFACLAPMPAQAQNDSRSDAGIRKKIDHVSEALKDWRKTNAKIIDAALKNPDPDGKERLYIDAWYHATLSMDKMAVDLFLQAGDKGLEDGYQYGATWCMITKQQDRLFQLAKQGNRVVQYMLAAFYETGKDEKGEGLDQDLTKALYWYTQSPTRATPMHSTRWAYTTTRARAWRRTR